MISFELLACPPECPDSSFIGMMAEEPVTAQVVASRVASRPLPSSSLQPHTQEVVPNLQSSQRTFSWNSFWWYFLCVVAFLGAANFVTDNFLNLKIYGFFLSAMLVVVKTYWVISFVCKNLVSTTTSLPRRALGPTSFLALGSLSPTSLQSTMLSINPRTPGQLSASSTTILSPSALCTQCWGTKLLSIFLPIFLGWAALACQGKSLIVSASFAQSSSFSSSFPSFSFRSLQLPQPTWIREHGQLQAWAAYQGAACQWSLHTSTQLAEAHLQREACQQAAWGAPSGAWSSFLQGVASRASRDWGAWVLSSWCLESLQRRASRIPASTSFLSRKSREFRVPILGIGELPAALLRQSAFGPGQLAGPQSLQQKQRTSSALSSKSRVLLRSIKLCSLATPSAWTFAAQTVSFASGESNKLPSTSRHSAAWTSSLETSLSSLQPLKRSSSFTRQRALIGEASAANIIFQLSGSMIFSSIPASTRSLQRALAWTIPWPSLSRRSLTRMR